MQLNQDMRNCPLMIGKAIKNLLVHRIVSSRLFLMTMVKCI